jgi:hypothetical protein
MLQSLFLLGIPILFCQLPSNPLGCDLNTLVERLGSSQFSVRQSSMEWLIDQPSDLLVKPLESVAAGRDLEKAGRAIRILSYYASIRRDNIGENARSSLQRLSASDLRPAIKSILVSAFADIQTREANLAAMSRSLEFDSDGNVTSLHCTPPFKLNEFVRFFGPIDSLRTIRLSHVTKRSELEVVNKCPSLEELCLFDMKRVNDDFAFLKGLPRLRVLYCDATNMQEEELANLKTSPQLKDLSLSNAVHVTNHGFSNLSQLRDLERLFVSNARINNDCLPPLQALKLKCLVINGAPLTDGCFEFIAKLDGLTALALCGTAITDSGVAKLETFPTLQSLYLTNTNVGDEAMAALARCRNLKQLVLVNTSVSDDGLRALGKSSSLEQLNLDGTKVTDSGLATIPSTSKLTNIDVPNCNVTAAAVALLRQRLPHLHVRMSKSR